MYIHVCMNPYYCIGRYTLIMTSVFILVSCSCFNLSEVERKWNESDDDESGVVLLWIPSVDTLPQKPQNRRVESVIMCVRPVDVREMFNKREVSSSTTHLPVWRVKIISKFIIILFMKNLLVDEIEWFELFLW